MNVLPVSENTVILWGIAWRGYLRGLKLVILHFDRLTNQRGVTGKYVEMLVSYWLTRLYQFFN